MQMKYHQKICTKILYISVRADYGGGSEHLFQLLKGQCKNKNIYAAIPSNNICKSQVYWDKTGEIIGYDKLISLPFRKFSLTTLIKLRNFIRKNQINIIHSHGKGAGVYSRLLKLLLGNNIKVIHTFHGLHIEEYGVVKKNIYLFYEKFLGRLTDKFIYVSASERSDFKKNGLSFSKKEIIILNGTPIINKQDCSRYKNDILKQYPFFEYAKVVTTISRFDYAKNMDLALRIATLLPEYIFFWIGDGPDKEKLRKKVVTENIKNIVFAGFEEEPVRFLSVSNVYLSTSRWEGLPLALLEAMSVGLPVVASDVVGNNDVVKGYMGSLFPLNDINKACNMIRFWIKSISSKSKNKIIDYHKNKFSSERMCRETYKIYRDLID